jgi:hypothetical protein
VAFYDPIVKVEVFSHQVAFVEDEADRAKREQDWDNLLSAIKARIVAAGKRMNGVVQGISTIAQWKAATSVVDNLAATMVGGIPVIGTPLGGAMSLQSFAKEQAALQNAAQDVVDVKGVIAAEASFMEKLGREFDSATDRRRKERDAPAADPTWEEEYTFSTKTATGAWHRYFYPQRVWGIFGAIEYAPLDRRPSTGICNGPPEGGWEWDGPIDTGGNRPTCGGDGGRRR